MQANKNIDNKHKSLIYEHSSIKHAFNGSYEPNIQ